MVRNPAWGFKNCFDYKTVKHIFNLVVKLVLIGLTHHATSGKLIQMCLFSLTVSLHSYLTVKEINMYKSLENSF